MDLRCSGRIPLGPGAEPRRNPSTAFCTWRTESFTWGTSVAGGSSTGPVAVGCLSRIAWMLVWLWSAMPPDRRACVALEN